MSFCVSVFRLLTRKINHLPTEEFLVADSTVTFKNPNSRGIKEAPVGFSFTTLFFGGIPALMRGHAGLGLVQILLAIITWSLSSIVFACIDNKMYVRYLVGEGSKVAGISLSKSKEALFAEIGIELEELPEN